MLCLFQLTGLWQNISKSKAILAEPRGSDRSGIYESILWKDINRSLSPMAEVEDSQTVSLISKDF